MSRERMTQVDLLQRVNALPKGQAFQISVRELCECAEGNLKSQLYDRLHPDDVVEFVEHIERNWDITVFINLEKDSVQIYKPESQYGR